VNSMPAASSADLMSTKLDVRLGGSPSNASYLFIVRPLTPDFWANCSIDHPTAARADRICTPVIIDNPPCGPYSDTIVPNWAPYRRQVSNQSSPRTHHFG
jgi:hypothetical protein